MRGVSCAALSLAACATSVAAAPNLIRMAALKPGEADFMRALPAYADCVIAHPGKELAGYLGTTANSGDADRFERMLVKAHPECPKLAGKFPTKPLQVRGAIFEALIRRDFAEVSAPPDFDTIPHTFRPERDGADLARLIYAVHKEPYDCTVRRQPAKVQEFLRTPPLSANERSDFAALANDIAACVGKGQNWELRSYRSRPYLAEVFYTLMKLSSNQRAIP